MNKSPTTVATAASAMVPSPAPIPFVATTFPSHPPTRCPCSCCAPQHLPVVLEQHCLLWVLTGVQLCFVHSWRVHTEVGECFSLLLFLVTRASLLTDILVEKSSFIFCLQHPFFLIAKFPKTKPRIRAGLLPVPYFPFCSCNLLL